MNMTEMIVNPQFRGRSGFAAHRDSAQQYSWVSAWFNRFIAYVQLKNKNDKQKAQDGELKHRLKSQRELIKSGRSHIYSRGRQPNDQAK